MVDFATRISCAFDEVFPWVLGIGAVALTAALLLAMPELLCLLVTFGLIEMAFPVVVLIFASFIFG